MLPNWSKQLGERRGFSLAEVMVALAVIFLIGGGLLNLGGRRNPAKTSGVAEVLEEEFRAARLDAMKGKTYVAVVFPSEGGNKPHTSSYYRLEGLQKPRLTRSVNLAEEYPGLSVFIGYWGLDGSALNDPEAGNTVTLGTSQQDWDFSQWEAPFPMDHHLVFGPTGKVYSSNLPRFDNAYHFLITEAVEFSGGNLDGIRTFIPTKVLAPNTVTVSLTGYVGTSRGVLAQNGSVKEASGEFQSATRPAHAPRVPGPSTTDPQIASVDIYPLPEPETLPAGVDATVDLRGYLTLEVSALDTDGDRVFCNWTAEKVSGGGSGSGAFSAPQQNQMDWQGGSWISTWEWRPPSDALAGDIYQLEVSVTDETGRTTQGHLGASGRVEVIAKGQIVYERGQDIWIVNADGTGERNLTNHPARDFEPAISPDGTRIAFMSNRTGSIQFFNMGADGTNVRKLPLGGDGKAPRGVAWSPRGNQLLVGLNETELTDWDNLREALFIWSADGSTRTQITEWGDFVTSSWHPNLPIIITSGNSSRDLWEVNLNTGERLRMAETPDVWEYNPRFSPDGKKVCFSKGPVSKGSGFPEGRDDDFDIVVADYTPGSSGVAGTISNQQKISKSGAVDLNASWSPDGSQLVFSSDRSGADQLYIVNANGTNLRQITTGGGSRPHWGKY